LRSLDALSARSMRIVVLPPAPAYRRPSWLVVGLAIPGIVAGAYVLGPVAPLVAAAAIGGLWLVFRIGPSVNDHLYGGPRSEGALLSAAALHDHRSGRLTVEIDAIRWTPYKRTSEAGAVPWTFRPADVATVELRERGGPQPSVELRFILRSGPGQTLRVFTRTTAAEAALRSAGGAV